MSDYPTALELFEKFRPKFQEVTLKANGFLRENYQLTDKVALCAYRGNEKVDWCNRYSHDHIDVAEAELAFDFSYKPSERGDLHDQLRSFVMNQINTRLLDGRTFTLMPAEPFTKLFDRNGFYGSATRYQLISVNGDPIPGFHAAGNRHEYGYQGTWTSFVPKDTPEAKAILAAEQYHYKQTLKARDVATEQREAEEAVATALAAVV